MVEAVQMHVLEYRAPWHGFDSRCGIEIYKAKDGRDVVVAIDLGAGSGLSVTNGAALIAEEVVKRFGVNPYKAVFVEHYPVGLGRRHPAWDFVDFKEWIGGHAHGVSWRPGSREAVEKIIKGEA
jgi:hypothetical protein